MQIARASRRGTPWCATGALNAWELRPSSQWEPPPSSQDPPPSSREPPPSSREPP